MGTGAVTLLYILANVVYLTVLPQQGMGMEQRFWPAAFSTPPKTASRPPSFSTYSAACGAFMMAGAILVSTFGCNNGLIPPGARVYSAMAKDGLFFRGAAKLHPKYHTPYISLAMQCVWTCLCTFQEATTSCSTTSSSP